MNTGDQVLDIVCGCSSVKKGLKVAVATVSTKLPNGLKIKKSTIRGFDSSGMLCSLSELGYLQQTNSILHLPQECVVGARLNSYFAKNDVLFEIAITPDRGDLLSIRGVVREIASLIDIEFNDDFFFTSVDNEAGILDFDVDLQSDGVKSYSLGYFEVSSLADTSLLYNNMLIANVMGSCPISPLVDLVIISWPYRSAVALFDYDKISVN